MSKIVLQPASTGAAVTHYDNTIENLPRLNAIRRFVSSNTMNSSVIFTRMVGTGESAVSIEYEEEIAPALPAMEIEEIAEVTGLSESYAVEIRRGEKTPRRRHWPVLVELAEGCREEADELRQLEQRFAHLAFDQDIRPEFEAFTLREISEVTWLSEGYLGKSRRAEKTSSLKHWPQVIRLIASC